jgi:hypothetical protein
MVFKVHALVAYNQPSLCKLPGNTLARKIDDTVAIQKQAKQLQCWISQTLKECACTLDHPDFVEFMRFVKAEDLQGEPQEQTSPVQHITPLEYGLIAQLAYTLTEEGVITTKGEIDQIELGRRIPWLIKEFRELFYSGWQLFGMSTSHRAQVGILASALDGDGGYRGIALIHYTKKQLVVAHRGTVSRKDVTADILGIMFNAVTDHQKAADNFCKEMVNEARANGIAVSNKLNDFALSFTGHSLGE